MAAPGHRGEIAFTFADALAVARHLQEFPSVVLVGGQALNFWAEQFRARVAALDRLAPFQSADIDFLGAISTVAECARRLGGAVAYPSLDQINTPEVGVVHCLVRDKPLKIDFLGYLAGLSSAEVRKAAIAADIGGVVLRVMHPVHVLRSRLANIMVLRRRDPLALRQMRVAIRVVAEYVRLAAAASPRDALDLIESLFKIAISRDGLKLHCDLKIDLFASMRPFKGLPMRFRDTRLPQMRALLRARRARYAAGRPGNPSRT